jgi:hypothetical protein
MLAFIKSTGAGEKCTLFEHVIQLETKHRASSPCRLPVGAPERARDQSIGNAFSVAT